MNYRLHSILFDATGMVVILIVVMLISTSQSVGQALSVHIPNSMQQLNTIFLSLSDRGDPFCTNRRANCGIYSNLCNRRNDQTMDSNQSLSCGSDELCDWWFISCL